MRPGLAAVGAAFLLVTGGIFGGLAVGTLGAPRASGPGPQIDAPIGGSGGDYAELYNETIHSVVGIRVDEDEGSAAGSGFVYAEDYVVTNEHVVGATSAVAVRFSTGAWREGTVVGTDPYTDLAVVRVETPPSAAPLPVAERPPRPGRPVAAVGSPFGLEGSITSGIVSGVNRSMPTQRGFTIPATVQTDAPINPGNSGGPLLAMDGTVIGVNRARAGDNIGFAISPRLVQLVVPVLIDTGSYDHSLLGVRTQSVTPAIAEASDLRNATGVYVVDVLDNGPSASVLEPANGTTTVDGREVPTGGDVIVSIDGHRVRDNQELGRVLMLHTRPGDRIPITVIRDGRSETVTVTLGARRQP